ncbi:MAG: Glycerophosphoryl diester phosphodiesterase [Verrucomicrobia bacterium ADurb.Bin070]|nr:MAG: Glycerophosphoryl diester phosphodiesterase [Verrucomicrobia bacterium ADurb.Bin070]
MTKGLIAGAVMLAVAWGNAANAPRLLAHRGGGKEYDENSLGAFKASYEKGLRGFETDIRLTKDNALVILHDDKLDRTTTGTGFIENLTADQVKALKLKKSGEPVPFAQDLMSYFKDKPDIFIELEMKTGNTNLYTLARLETYCKALHEAAQSTLPRGAYFFTSFDKRALGTMKRLYPDADIGLIVGGALDEKVIKTALELGCKRVAPVMDKTCRKAVSDAKKAGLGLTGWPTLSEADYALGVALGFDCLTTDYPVKLHQGLTVKTLR